MADGWTWLRGGVLLMVLTGGFLLSRPARPRVCTCDWAMKRVIVSMRSIAAGESLGEGMRVDEIREQDVPEDAFVMGEDEEDSPAYEYVLGIAMGPGEIIRRDSVILKRPSVFDTLQ